MKMKKLAFLPLLLLFSCQQSPEAFQHTLDSEQKPWNHTRFDNQDSKFTFAIFSDLTAGEREGIFSVAMEQLNLLRPELIVNVGDLVEGILDKTRHVPLGRDTLVFEKSVQEDSN